jgi:carbonic anhydrase
MRDLLSLVFLVSGATASTFLHSPQKSTLIEVSRHNAAVRVASDDWDYDDEGASWTTMGSCGSTTLQSPINFSTTSAAASSDTSNFYFKYPIYETPVMMKNDGRTLYNYIDNADGSVGGIAFGQSYPSLIDEAYYLYKMIIHTPSEHTFNGIKVPCELQLFHRKSDANLTNGEPDAADTAVVAVGFEESADEASAFLLSLLDGGLPDQRGAQNMVNRDNPSALHFTELLRAKFGAHDARAVFWQYTGSLTQPPCSTGVKWFVRIDTLNAKKATLQTIQQAAKKASGGIPANARTFQAVGSRAVFARFANDATHKEVFSIDAPDAFAAALDKAVTEQSTINSALSGTNSSNSSGTQSAAYTSCLSELGEVIESLNTAKALEDNACSMMEAAKNTLDSAAGAARLEASTQYATQKKSCEDEKDRVEALENERDDQQTQCDSLENSGESTSTTASSTSTTG